MPATLNRLVSRRLKEERLGRPVETPGFYPEYAADPVGFAEEVLGERLTDDVKAVLESVRDNPVTIAMSANATGKTHGAARVAAWFYKTRLQSKVFTAAAPPEKNLKTLLWGELGTLVDRHADLFEHDQTPSLHIARSDESYITGLTIPSSGTASEREARFSGKHAPHILFIIDEGDAVPDAVYRGIESCLSGGEARLLIMFNPRAESGAVYRMIERREAHVVHLSAFSHPNVITGRDVIPGAVDRETTVRRINEWTRPLAPSEKPDDECFEVPSFLVGAVARRKDGTLYPALDGGWRKVIEQAFFYMVLGRYPTQGTQQLISRKWINDARSRYDAYVAKYGLVPPVGAEAIAGLDVSEFGEDSNALCFRYGGLVMPLLLWKGMDPDDTAIKAARHCTERSCSSARVDATGVGAGVPGGMRKEMKGSVTGVKVAKRATLRTDMGDFYRLRDQIYWSIREWLRTDTGAMLPPDDRLIEELKTPTYSIKEGTIRVMQKKTMRELLRRSPDRLEALGMTFAPEEPPPTAASKPSERAGRPTSSGRMIEERRGTGSRRRGGRRW